MKTLRVLQLPLDTDTSACPKEPVQSRVHDAAQAAASLGLCSLRLKTQQQVGQHGTCAQDHSAQAPVGQPEEWMRMDVVTHLPSLQAARYSVATLLGSCSWFLAKSR